MQLCTATYLLTQKFPREELYGLTNQLRRASVSIPPTSPRVMDAGQENNTSSFCPLHSALTWSSKHS
ncbi:MAG: four helix bundle protein [Acidobacteriaceae bacterium]